eukprot:jgi/Ulvmu1/1383/UM011_0111.1
MVLTLSENTVVTASRANIIEALENSHEVQDGATKFLNACEDITPDRCKHIHVLQGECAHVDLCTEPASGLLLASHAATTCVIIVLHCPLSRRAFVAHLDGCKDHDLAQVTVAIQSMQSPDVLLVGAYDDGGGCGARVLSGVLCHLEQLPLCCRIRLFCCGKLNTSGHGQPLAQGLCYHSQSRASHCPPPDTPAVPCGLRRQALWWASMMCGRPTRGLSSVYDTTSGTLVLPGMHARWPRQASVHIAGVITQTDNAILQMCSTSPDVELPGFAAGVRAKLQWCLDNIKEGMLQVASETLYFTHGQGWLPTTPDN